MAVKKTPNMAKPKKDHKGAATGMLMDNQDTINRGDGRKAQKVPTSILLPQDLKARVQEMADRRGTTLTRIVIDGLYKELEEFE